MILLFLSHPGNGIFGCLQLIKLFGVIAVFLSVTAVAAATGQ